MAQFQGSVKGNDHKPCSDGYGNPKVSNSSLRVKPGQGRKQVRLEHPNLTAKTDVMPIRFVYRRAFAAQILKHNPELPGEVLRDLIRNSESFRLGGHREP